MLSDLHCSALGWLQSTRISKSMYMYGATLIEMPSSCFKSLLPAAHRDGGSQKHLRFSLTPAAACLQRMELEAVKKERTQLMASLAQIKADSGKAGGELQAEDVRRLRKELELKLQKLNELKRVRCCMGWRVAQHHSCCCGACRGTSLNPAWFTAQQQANCAQQQQVLLSMA